MAGIKEIRTKIKSVQNTRKITKAMEMVAASKMRKAQDRMRAGRPYALKVREIAAHLMQAHPDYTHPYMIERSEVRAVGVVVVTTDKGLCGGLNTNIMRVVLARLKEFEQKGIKTQFTAFGNKGVGTLARIRANLVSQDVQLGDKPNLERLIGAIKVQLDDFVDGKIDAVYLATNRFVNTMKQDPSYVCCRCPAGCPTPSSPRLTTLKPKQRKSSRSTAGTTSMNPTPGRSSTSCCCAMSKGWCTRRLRKTWPPSSRLAWWP
jgi:F-type H+-transporting ATPase subunit gamma